MIGQTGSLQEHGVAGIEDWCHVLKLLRFCVPQYIKVIILKYWLKKYYHSTLLNIPCDAKITYMIMGMKISKHNNIALMSRIKRIHYGSCG